MNPVLTGIHHVTAMASDAQTNLDFYVTVLGLRLVKRTVNFDDPGTYHFYFGDQTGTPGTLLTFFPFGKMARRGRAGVGQSTAFAYAIPADSVDYWRTRLAQRGITVRESQRFGETVLALEDPDGLTVELIASGNTDSQRVWNDGPVPTEYAVRGFHSVTLTEWNHEPTAKMLTDVMGFHLVAQETGQEGDRYRYAVAEGVPGTLVDVLVVPDGERGKQGAGTIHHIAFRTPDDANQVGWQQRIVDTNAYVTDVRDRTYFHSIYYYEPGGVLFEIATDPPGFLIDEAEAELGTHLKLPSWLESSRGEIERVVAPLTLPEVSREENTVG